MIRYDGVYVYVCIDHALGRTNRAVAAKKAIRKEFMKSAGVTDPQQIDRLQQGYTYTAHLSYHIISLNGYNSAKQAVSNYLMMDSLAKLKRVTASGTSSSVLAAGASPPPFAFSKKYRPPPSGMSGKSNGSLTEAILEPTPLPEQSNSSSSR
jgi:hypothetical protein